ncbi:MAG: hypothetical protein MJZ17_10560 [Bacteroidales bacterium]|nr:hypothetical protein [Bacteroidales bacterium]
MKIKLKILTPGWSREVEADAIFLPGTVSPFEVLPGHASMVSALDAGDVRWRNNGEEECLAVKGGVVRVGRNEIVICAEA